MGRPVGVWRIEDRIAKFLESYHSILDYEVHNNLQKDLMDVVEVEYQPKEEQVKPMPIYVHFYELFMCDLMNNLFVL
jgi:hypothetical protein